MNNLFDKYKLLTGRMISASKSSYREKHPEHKVYFNANVFVNGAKVWFGDLDLTLDREKLQKIADEAGESLHILKEMDGRFGKETNPDLTLAVDVIKNKV